MKLGMSTLVGADRRARGLYWTRAWNLVGGCTPVSAACDHCWAASEANMRSHNPNPKMQEKYAGLTKNGKFNGTVRFNTANLILPLKSRKSAVWAIWTDLAHETITLEQFEAALGIMSARPQDVFILLTKRPERLPVLIRQVEEDCKGRFITPALIHHAACIVDQTGDEMNANHPYTAEKAAAGRRRWPLPNVFLGTTVEDQVAADRRVPHLLACAGWRTMVSVEPALGPVRLDRLRHERGSYDALIGCVYDKGDTPLFDTSKLDWVIAGCESAGGRAGKRPSDLDWFRQLAHQCQEAGVPFFLKQAVVNGEFTKLPALDGVVHNAFPEISK